MHKIATTNLVCFYYFYCFLESYESCESYESYESIRIYTVKINIIPKFILKQNSLTFFSIQLKHCLTACIRYAK